MHQMKFKRIIGVFSTIVAIFIIIAITFKFIKQEDSQNHISNIDTYSNVESEFKELLNNYSISPHKDIQEDLKELLINVENISDSYSQNFDVKPKVYISNNKFRFELIIENSRRKIQDVRFLVLFSEKLINQLTTNVIAYPAKYIDNVTIDPNNDSENGLIYGYTASYRVGEQFDEEDFKDTYTIIKWSEDGIERVEYLKLEVKFQEVDININL